MQLLSKAIHQILTTDTDILESVGSGNIWHSKVPQRNTSGADTPPQLSIYYYTFAVTPNDTKSGASQVDDHMLRVCIIGKDDDTMYEVARYVRYALDRITPGTYAGIPIDGVRFLNAGFDPEGSFELENQSWVLEFKVRVIDNDIRVPGGTPAEFGTPLWWYSLEEQEWPYGKWLNGETIYWKTFVFPDGEDDNELTGIGPDIVDQFVRIDFTYSGDNKNVITHDVGQLQAINGVYTIHTYAVSSDNRVTVWYTKL